VCLNVDGSFLGATSSAGYGGLIRANKRCFYGAAVVRSILFPELMVVLHGLQICWEGAFRRITCFSDSLQTVNLIWEGVYAHHWFVNELLSIRQLLARDCWEVVINHTLREDNACVDVLAKMGALSNSPLVKISTPPSEFSLPLLAERRG
jgi:ribonuclease HI